MLLFKDISNQVLQVLIHLFGNNRVEETKNILHGKDNVVYARKGKGRKNRECLTSSKRNKEIDQTAGQIAHKSYLSLKVTCPFI